MTKAKEAQEKAQARTLNDARCAWRKMSPAQRGEFFAFPNIKASAASIDAAAHNWTEEKGTR